MFRHLYGVSEDEVRRWTLSKWRLYQEYARTILTRGGGDMTDG